jgi:septum formation protein
VQTADIDESPRPGESPRSLVLRLALAKALAVREADDEQEDASLYIAADTVVVRDADILGKPADHDEARRMLASLAGRAHEVITGFCVLSDVSEHVEAISTTVWFRPLESDVIARYVEGGEPMDKAGSYGIQGGGGALVARIEGSYSNVVGLPLVETLAALAALGGPRL